MDSLKAAAESPVFNNAQREAILAMMRRNLRAHNIAVISRGAGFPVAVVTALVLTAAVGRDVAMKRQEPSDTSEQ